MAKIDRFTQNIPKLFKPGINPVITALLQAWAQEDDSIVTQLKNTKSQLFLATAGGQYLDRLASGLGVSRDQVLQLSDQTFQQLIPNLTLKPKQIRKTLYEMLSVFWGPLFSCANVTSTNFAPFNVSTGDVISVQIDNNPVQTITVKAGQIASPGAATATEIATILSQIDDATVSVITASPTTQQYINIRTNTNGIRGSVTVNASSMISSGKLNFTTKTYRISDLSQRVCIYEIRNREIVVELPALVPILKTTLKGSHHFHAHATLESPVAPSNGVWQGSFLYSRSTTPFNVTKNVGVLNGTIQAGQVYTQLTVDSTAGFPNQTGYLVLDWGLNTQEEPVRYIAIPNSATILLDPSYVFRFNHANGARINLLAASNTPAKPAVDGHDLATYMISPATARVSVQTILQSLIAAGVVVNFVILLPTYYTDITPSPYS